MQRAGWGGVSASKPLAIVLALVMLLVPAVSSVLVAGHGDDHDDATYSAQISVQLWSLPDPVGVGAFDDGQPLAVGEPDDDGSAEGHHHHGDVHDDAADTSAGVRAPLRTTSGHEVGSSSVPGDDHTSTSRPD